MRKILTKHWNIVQASTCFDPVRAIFMEHTKSVLKRRSRVLFVDVHKLQSVVIQHYVMLLRFWSLRSLRQQTEPYCVLLIEILCAPWRWPSRGRNMQKLEKVFGYNLVHFFMFV
jgi:hypothetical protein